MQLPPIQIFDDIIFAFFALEMTIKMVAMGICGKNTYLADSWNRLDFFIVLAGLLEYVMHVENLNLTAIRTIRVLRPLRAINRIPSKCADGNWYSEFKYVTPNPQQACESWWCSCWTRCPCWAMSCCSAFSCSSSSELLESSCGREFCDSDVVWCEPKAWSIHSRKYKVEANTKRSIREWKRKPGRMGHIGLCLLAPPGLIHNRTYLGI